MQLDADMRCIAYLLFEDATCCTEDATSQTRGRGATSSNFNMCSAVWAANQIFAAYAAAGRRTPRSQIQIKQGLSVSSLQSSKAFHRQLPSRCRQLCRVPAAPCGACKNLRGKRRIAQAQATSHHRLAARRRRTGVAQRAGRGPLDPVLGQYRQPYRLDPKSVLGCTG